MAFHRNRLESLYKLHPPVPRYVRRVKHDVSPGRQRPFDLGKGFVKNSIGVFLPGFAPEQPFPDRIRRHQHGSFPFAAFFRIVAFAAARNTGQHMNGTHLHHLLSKA
ncbi:hypothetical protein D1872_235770 [compost metagenome]